MNAFADWLFRALLGWTGQAANSIWNAVVNSAGGISDFFSRYWLGVLLVLIIGGTVLDYAVWFARWRPYLVWRSWLHRRKRRRMQTDAARSLDQGQMDEQAQSALAGWAAVPQDQSPVNDLYDTPPPYATWQQPWQPQWPREQAQQPPVWQEEPAVYAPPANGQPAGPWAAAPSAYQPDQNPYAPGAEAAPWQPGPEDAGYAEPDPEQTFRPPWAVPQQGAAISWQQDSVPLPLGDGNIPYADEPGQPLVWPGQLHYQPLDNEEALAPGAVAPLSADSFDDSLAPGLAAELYEQPWDPRAQEPQRPSRRRRTERAKPSGVTRLLSSLKNQLTADNAEETMLDGLPSPVDQQDAFHEAVYPQNYRYQMPHENGGHPPAEHPPQ